MVNLMGDDFGDPSELSGGGGNRVSKPGRYHVAIQAFDDSFATRPEVVVDFTILAGTEHGQENKGYREWFHIGTPEARKRLWILAIASGAISQEQAASKADIALTSQMMVGRQLILELIEDEYQGKKRVKMSYASMYSLTDTTAASVPRNQAALSVLRQAGIACDPPQGNSNAPKTNGSAGHAPQAANAPAASGANPADPFSRFGL